LIYNLRQAAAGAVDLYLYDDIVPGFWDEPGASEKFRMELEACGEAQEIRVHVNSYGGDVKEGYGIYAVLKAHPARKVCFVDGMAASIASVICTACDEVRMYGHSMMFLHNMECGARGTAQALRKAADDLDKMMEGNRQAYLQKAGGKLDEARLIEMLDAQTWLTAKEAQECGLCDQILDMAPPRIPDAEIEQAYMRLAQQAAKPQNPFKLFGQNKKEDN